MKILTIIFVVLCLSLVHSATPDDFVKNSFNQWKAKYIKNTLMVNITMSFANFKKTLMAIKKQDLAFFKGKSKFQMKLNGRAADDPSAMRSWNGLLPETPAEVTERSVQPTFPPPPPSLDYRQQGLVTPVADQGYTCSSCYAFAAASALEGQVAKHKGRLVELSKQQQVDCSWKFGNLGCDGGYMTSSYNYAIKSPGLADEAHYPYTGTEDKCSYTSKESSASVSSFKTLVGDEYYLMSALAAIGPLAVGMKGDVDSFYYYGGGIYDDFSCFGVVNHAVSVVGYGTDYTTRPPIDYWIVKNSWSTDWGEDGYFKLLRGSNLCNITNYVVYPTL